MSAVARVSAFAKRRKLNDDSTVPTSGSDDSSSAPFAKIAKASEAVPQGVNEARKLRHRLSEVGPVATEVESDGDENSFAPLVDAKVVSFTGTREIETFDDHSCRVRLSRGQKCSLQGITTLWVREGSVSIDGAVVTGSFEAYTIFCSTSGLFTEIVGQSKLAEFELTSVPPGEEALPFASNVPGKLGELARVGAASFQVLDRAYEAERDVSDATSNINRQIQTISATIRTSLGPNTTSPRILVCGKRSIDTYRTSVTLVNHLLTTASNSGGPPSPKIDKIAYLDLDHLSPAFSAPGTISMAILQKAVFGPSYTQPLQCDLDLQNYLVTSQYVKAIEDSETSRLDLNCVQAILQTAKDHLNGTYLVIRTGSWFAHMPATERSRFQKLLQLNLAVCIDTRRSSQHLEAITSLAKDASDLSVLHLPVSPNSSLSSLQEHKLQLQSHFRIYGMISDTPLWYRDPLPDVPAVRRLVLSTDISKDGLKFIQVRGGMLRPQDIPSAIHQNLVVIVAAQNDGTTTSNTAQHGSNRDRPDSGSRHVSAAGSLLEIRSVEEDRTLHFIGLAFVEAVDPERKELTLNTPVSRDKIRRYVSLHYEIGLVLEKPGTDGRFGRHLLFT